MPASRELTSGQATALAGGELIGAPDIRLVGVAPLDRAGPDELSFLAGRRYVDAFRASRAGAVLLPPAFRDLDGGPAVRIVTEDPYRALAHILPRLAGAPTPAWGVHPSARLGRGLRWSGRLAVGPGATIGADVVLGGDCVIEAGARIGDRTRLGHGCRVGVNASVEADCELGNDVWLWPGARVGTAGFGYAAGADAPAHVAHVGRCILEDQVHVGANTTIDRGSVGDTVIGAATKIDNLVQIGHNCRIGRRCLIMAQVGMAGTTVLEDDVALAGQAGLAGHLTVGTGARVAAQGGVIGDVPPGATVSGYPARSHRDVLRQAAALHRLTPLVSRLEALAAEHARRG